MSSMISNGLTLLAGIVAAGFVLAFAWTAVALVADKLRWRRVKRETRKEGGA